MSDITASALEKPRLRLGLLPLADAAPLVVAHDLGLYGRYGLEVILSAEASWASLRDKLATGVLDAAPMLAPMPLAATLGIDGLGEPMTTRLVLSRNGNTITLSRSLFERLGLESLDDPLASGVALRRLLDAEREAGLPPRVFAHVFPFSTHHYELRYWLAGCGIDPDRDVDLVVVPPPRMVERLVEGAIDGFCVGAPWGELAESLHVGRRLVSKHQIWPFGPEKVLGVTRAWDRAHPDTHQALREALLEACRWLDADDHRAQAARWLAASGVLAAEPEIVAAALARSPAGSTFGPGLVFHDGAGNLPRAAEARWFIAQMRRWGQIEADRSTDGVAEAVFQAPLRDRSAVLAEPAGTAAKLAQATDKSRYGPRAPIPDGDAATRFFDGQPLPSSTPWG